MTKLDELLPLNGRCTCSKVKYQLLNKPLFVHCCHCTWCQRETGASFALNAFIETHNVKLLQGKTETIYTPTSSTGGQKIIRCTSCKIALWSHYSGAGWVEPRLPRGRYSRRFRERMMHYLFEPAYDRDGRIVPGVAVARLRL